MSAHTNGPWFTEDPPADPYIVYGGGIHGNGERREICHTATLFFGCDEAIANARLIVRAVNAHDDLLAALRRLEVSANTVDGCYTRNPDNFAAALSNLRDDAESARAAIAKVEGRDAA